MARRQRQSRHPAGRRAPAAQPAVPAVRLPRDRVLTLSVILVLLALALLGDDRHVGLVADGRQMIRTAIAIVETGNRAGAWAGLHDRTAGRRCRVALWDGHEPSPGARRKVARVGALNLIYSVGDQLNLIASAGRAFRSPNLMERFFQGGTPEGSGYQLANADLKPEKSLSVDLGAKLSTSGRRWRGSSSATKCAME